MEHVSRGVALKTVVWVALVVAALSHSLCTAGDWTRSKTVEDHRAAFTDRDIGLIIERFIEINGGRRVVTEFGLYAVEALGGWLDILADSPALAALYTERLKTMAMAETRGALVDEQVVISRIEQELCIPTLTREAPIRHVPDEDDDEDEDDWLDIPGFQMGLGVLIGAAALGIPIAIGYLARLGYRYAHGGKGEVSQGMNFNGPGNNDLSEERWGFSLEAMAEASQAFFQQKPPLPPAPDSPEFEIWKDMILVSKTWAETIKYLEILILRSVEESNVPPSPSSNSKWRNKSPWRGQNSSGEVSNFNTAIAPSPKLSEAPLAFRISGNVLPEYLINAIRYVSEGIKLFENETLPLQDKMYCLGFIHAVNRRMKEHQSDCGDEKIRKTFQVLCSEFYNAAWGKSLSNDETEYAKVIKEWADEGQVKATEVAKITPLDFGRRDSTSPRSEYGLTRSGRRRNDGRHLKKSKSTSGKGSHIRKGSHIDGRVAIPSELVKVRRKRTGIKSLF